MLPDHYHNTLHFAVSIVWNVKSLWRVVSLNIQIIAILKQFHSVLPRIALASASTIAVATKDVTGAHTAIVRWRCQSFSISTKGPFAISIHSQSLMRRNRWIAFSNNRIYFGATVCFDHMRYCSQDKNRKNGVHLFQGDSSNSYRMISTVKERRNIYFQTEYFHAFTYDLR